MNKTKGKTKGKTKNKTKQKSAKVIAMTPNQIKARKNWKRHQIKAGKCIECTKKAIKNKRTGKPGLRCRVHQDQANVRNQASREKARKAAKKLARAKKGAVSEHVKRTRSKHAQPADTQAAA